MWARLADRVTLVDMVHEDVAHAAGVMVEDLDDRLFANQVADVPVLPEEDLVVLFVSKTILQMPGRSRSHLLAVDQQAHTGLAGESPAADHEIDILALDVQRR